MDEKWKKFRDSKDVANDSTPPVPPVSTVTSEENAEDDVMYTVKRIVAVDGDYIRVRWEGYDKWSDLWYTCSQLVAASTLTLPQINRMVAEMEFRSEVLRMSDLHLPPVGRVRLDSACIANKKTAKGKVVAPGTLRVHTSPIWIMGKETIKWMCTCSREYKR